MKTKFDYTWRTAVVPEPCPLRCSFQSTVVRAGFLGQPNGSCSLQPAIYRLHITSRMGTHSSCPAMQAAVSHDAGNRLRHDRLPARAATKLNTVCADLRPISQVSWHGGFRSCRQPVLGRGATAWHTNPAELNLCPRSLELQQHCSGTERVPMLGLIGCIDAWLHSRVGVNALP